VPVLGVFIYNCLAELRNGRGCGPEKVSGRVFPGTLLFGTGWAGAAERRVRARLRVVTGRSQEFPKADVRR